MPPLLPNLAAQIQEPLVVRASLQQTAVGIKAGHHPVDVLIRAGIQALDGPDSVFEGCIVEMCPIGPDMAPEKLASVLVWLVVELTLIEPYTLQGQAPAKLRKQSEKVAVAFFRDYENDIIHEAAADTV